MRVRIDRLRVAAYAASMWAGDLFPPPVVFIDKNGRHWVGDGFHRIEAAAKNGAKEIQVDLRRGGWKEAVLWNLGANQNKQGLPLLPGDIKKAIQTLLLAEEFRGHTRQAVARLVGCRAAYVSEVARGMGLPMADRGNRRPRIDRAEVKRLKEQGRTNREIAEKLGFSESAARKVARELGLAPDLDTRTRASGVSEQMVAELAAKGLSIPAIAKKLGIARATVTARLQASKFAPCPECNGTGRVLRPE